MSDLSTRQSIQVALARFTTEPLAEAALELFKALGYRSDKRLRLSPNTAEQFLSTFGHGRALNERQALPSEWKSIDFLFQLADDDVRAAAAGAELLPFDSRAKWNGSIIQSYVFLAVEMKGSRYTRTALAGVTRELNKLFKMPALVLYRHGETLTLAIIHRRVHKRDEAKDVLEKVTLIRDVRAVGTHRAHIEILHDLSLPALQDKHPISHFAALQEAWQKTLDTSALNQRFYQELSNWYQWALDNAQFPAGAPKDQARDSISLIRLITRIVFCWFLREKGLIPADLFNEGRVRALLTSLGDDENTFYTAILQNLFFATLNTEMDERGRPPTRRFVKEGGTGYSDDHMVHQVWRHEKRIKDKKGFERLLRTVPFLNGGLFECLDERQAVPGSSRTQELRVDGFSVKPEKQPRVPNFLFFGPDRVVDLSNAYHELRYTETRVRPLISLLDRYKFTVAENTPIEEEVALDPELLGHVFENLLASYNPETDKTARKTTGSFYTPRVVVDFMVDEALIVHLESRLKAAFPKSKAPFEPRLRQLLRYTEEAHRFDEAEAAALIDAIDQVKILDPACGSGAFPMGALHKLVFILSKLDPGNGAWQARQLVKARALDVGREAAIKAVEDAFGRDEGDYGRKLYLIENCLYGVDIQPIATQIAKLRCFISLVVEQELDDKLPNRGILPLPNLETKFIAANTLLGLHRKGQMQLVTQAVAAKQADLRRLRHEHFLARGYREKSALRGQDEKARAELARLLKSSGFLPGSEAELLASWNPYHADRSAPFFDPESMFNFATPRAGAAGFDIVIGNPPYVRQEELKNQKVFKGVPAMERPLKEALKDDYFCYTGVADLFVYFYERSFDLLAVGGVLSFITSNKYFRAGYGEKLRHFLAVNGEIRILIDFGDAPVFTAIAYPSILVVRKTRETRDKESLYSIPKDPNKWLQLVPSEAQVRSLTWESGPSVEDFPGIVRTGAAVLPQRHLSPEGWRLTSEAGIGLLAKLKRRGPALGDYVNGQFFNGVKTGLNEAFVVDDETKTRLIAEDASSAGLFKPFLRGRDIKRWTIVPSGRWVIYVPWHFPLHADDDITNASARAEKAMRKEYPAIYEHLSHYRSELARRDKAETGIRYEWYSLARPRFESMGAFEQPKIIIPTIADNVEYAFDRKGYLSNDKTTICLARNPQFLLGLLNSKVLWWFIRKVAATKQGGFYEFKPMYVSTLPIAACEKDVERGVTHLVQQVIAKRRSDSHAPIADLETEIDGMVAHLYDLTEDEYRLILDDLALPEPVRVNAINAYRDHKRSSS